MKKFRGPCIALTAAIAALTLTAPTAVRAADPVNIDVITALTGGGTFIGKAEQDTLHALEGVVNREGGIKGRPVHFVFHDDQTSPQVTVQLTQAVISSKANVLIGSTLAAMCSAQVPLVKEGPVQYCLSPAIHPAAGSFTFSGTFSTKDQMLAFIRYFRARGWKRMAIVSSTDASGQDADVELANALALPENKDGVVMVDQEHFNVTDLNVAAQLTRIKAANPQVIIAYSPGTPFGSLLRGIQNAGIELPVATGNGNMSYEQMKQYASILPKELYFPGQPVVAKIATTAKARQVQGDFYKAFDAMGIKPDGLYVLAWDPAMIIIDALRALGPNAAPEQIRQYIAGLHDYTGVSGVYDFRDGSQRGLTTKDVVIMRWDVPKGTWLPASDLGGLHVYKK